MSKLSYTAMVAATQRHTVHQITGGLQVSYVPFMKKKMVYESM